jgi:MFS transporter, DHA1 family, tetracycline resistance protein
MKRSLAVVYLAVFIDLLGFGIIIPALPFFALKFGASGLMLGALMSGYSLFQMLGAPLWGRFSDRWGRKPVLLICLFSSSVSLFLTGLADGLALLLAARILAGLFGGSLGVAQAVVADVTSPDERAKTMGFLGASIGLGFVLGPALGALLSGFGFGFTAFMASLLALLNFVLGIFFLKETLPEAGSRGRRTEASLENLKQGLARPDAQRFIFCLFFIAAGLVAMETTLAPMAQYGLSLKTREFGYLMSFAGVVMVVVQGGMLGPLVRRFGEARLAFFGGLMGALGLGLMSLAARGGSLILTVELMGLLAAGYGLAYPCLAALLSKTGGSNEQGGMMGLGQATGALARSLVPLLAGAVFDFSPHLPYILGAISMAVAGLLARRGPGFSAKGDS